MTRAWTSMKYDDIKYDEQPRWRVPCSKVTVWRMVTRGWHAITLWFTFDGSINDVFGCQANNGFVPALMVPRAGTHLGSCRWCDIGRLVPGYSQRFQTLYLYFACKPLGRIWMCVTVRIFGDGSGGLIVLSACWWISCQVVQWLDNNSLFWK